MWSNRGQLYGSKDDEACGRIEDSCMVQKTREVVVEQRTIVWFKRRGSLWSNRGQLFGSKDDEACVRIEDSCMVQNSIRLYQVMSRLLFRIVIDTCKTYLFVNRKYNIISITGLFHILILVPFVLRRASSNYTQNAYNYK